MRALLAAVTCHKEQSNLAQHLAVMREAAAADCHVAVFPEFSLTGSVDPARHPERAVSCEAAIVQAVVAATGAVGVGALFGIAERASKGFYITQLYASGGKIRAKQQKRHLGEDESAYSTAPASPTPAAVFTVAKKRCGVIICAEAGVEFTWRDTANAGAEVVFFCSAPGLYGRRTNLASWQSGLSWWESCGLADARREAVGHGLWVGMATQAGSAEDEDFPGIAALIDPHGHVVDRTADWRPGTLIVDISPTGSAKRA